MTGSAVALPAGWVRCTLAECCEIQQGQSPPSASYTTDPSVGISFLQGNAEFGEVVPTPTKRTTAPQKVADERSVLLSVRAPVGATNLAPGRVAIGRGLSAVTPLGGTSRRFVMWLLRARRADLEASSTGTTFAAVTGRVVRSLAVSLPPHKEQDRIVAALESEFARVDTGAQSIEKALRGLERLRLASLGRLLAEAHPRIRVEEVGTVFVGFTPSRRDPTLWDGEVPWVSSGEVAFGRISATKETIADGALGNRERRLHPRGTVLIAMYGEGKTRGQAAILDLPAATNQAVAAIRIDPARMTPEFLFYCLMRQYNEVRATARGGQQINLNGELIRSIELPQPPIEEQRRLIAELEERLAAASQLDADLTVNLKAADALRRSILNHAMTGRLVPQDPSDEPASELLERVKVEKAQREPARRRSRATSAAPG